MYWVNIFHIYQPPKWSPKIINKVAKESYYPFIKELKKNPDIHITLNLTGSLTEQLKKLGHGKLLNQIKILVSRGQIELITTGAWHPIFPLIPKALIKAQLASNKKINQSLFKKTSPAGCWLPELAYSPNLDGLLLKENISWVVLDEIAANKQGVSGVNHHWQTKKGLKILFRNTEACQFFFQPLSKKTLNTLQKHLTGTKPLITATDGENLGHHNPKMLKIWFRLALKKQIITLTASQFIKKFSKSKLISARGASWADNKLSIRCQNPYILWYNKDNPIHTRQWELTNLAVKIALREKELFQINRLIYSDQYWWASGRPWWDGQVINKASEDLKNFIKLKGRPGEIRRAEAATVHINKMVAEKSLDIKNKERNVKIMFGGEKH